jgi:guanyl-specific ribonuclease Sa
MSRSWRSPDVASAARRRCHAWLAATTGIGIVLSLIAALALMTSPIVAFAGSGRAPGYVYDAVSTSTTSTANLSVSSAATNAGFTLGSGQSISSSASFNATEDAAGGGADVAFGPAPENAWNTFDQVEAKGSPLPGYKGGGSFANDGRAGSQILPPEGAPYSKWDVNPNVKGVDRGGERIVTGSNGTAYYTSNHYQSFTQFWGPGQ